MSLFSFLSSSFSLCVCIYDDFNIYLYIYIYFFFYCHLISMISFLLLAVESMALERIVGADRSEHIQNSSKKTFMFW